MVNLIIKYELTTNFIYFELIWNSKSQLIRARSNSGRVSTSKLTKERCVDLGSK